MKSKLRLFFKEESGVAVIFLAISMVVLMGFTALAVDFGLVYYQRSQLQTALDSAALAAAQKLPDSAAARQTAIEYAKKNGVKVNSDDEIIVEFLNNDTIVKVTASKETKTSFARIFNVDTILSVGTAAAQSKEIKLGQQTFDYLLFSGSRNDQLTLGSSFDIYGSVHTNNKYFFSPGHGYVQGEISGVAPGSYYNPWTFNAGSVNPQASHVEMPDFSDAIAKNVPPYPTDTAVSNFNYAQRKLDSIVGYVSPAPVNSLSQQYLTLNGKTMYSGPLSLNIWGATTINGEIYVNGSAYFQGKVIMNSSNDLLCVKGPLTIGGGLSGKGTLIVNGDLNINGPGPYTFDGDIYVAGNINTSTGLNATGKIVCKKNIYIGGYFNFNGPSANVPGVIYCDGTLKTGNTYKGKADIICQNNIEFSGGTVEHEGLMYSATSIKFGSGIKSTQLTLLCKGDIDIPTICDVAKGVIYSGNNILCSSVYRGSAYIFAYNDVLFRGQLDSTHTLSEVAIYAINGNIEISLASTNVTGIVYAPKGNIHFGGSVTLKGNLIANSFSGSYSQLTLEHNPNGNPLDTGKTINRIVLVQ